MKKNISILSIALVVGLFAAGCSKGLEKCSDAKKAKDCTTAKDDKKCAIEFKEADKTGDDADVICHDESAVKDVMDKKCVATTLSNASDAKTSQAECEAVAKLFKGDHGHKCELDGNKCKFTAKTK